MKSSWTLDWICGFLVVHLLPHHRPADAEEVPQVAEDSSVERVLLVSAVLQVRDPVTWHELPGGAVDGDQVEVAAQQHHHHHGEKPDESQRCQQEPVRSEPQLPCDAGWNPRPETYTALFRNVQGVLCPTHCLAGRVFRPNQPSTESILRRTLNVNGRFVLWTEETKRTFSFK